MNTPRAEVTAFTQAAGTLGAALLADLAARDREMADKVAQAVEQGAQMSLTFYASGPTRIEFAVTDDYGTRRIVSTVGLAEIAKH